MPTTDPEKLRAKARRKYKRRTERDPDWANSRARKYYLNNREKVLERAKIYNQSPEVKARIKERSKEYQLARKQERQKWAAELKSGPCAECGGRFLHCAMDWHHIEGGGRKFPFHSASRARVLREIQKCVLLCANCHRIKHYKPG